MAVTRSWDLAVVGNAWEMLKAQPGLWMLGTLMYVLSLIVLMIGIFAVVGSMLGQLRSVQPSFGLILPIGARLVILGIGAVIQIITQFWLMSMMNLALKQLDGLPVGTDDLVNMRGQGGKALLAALSVGLIITAIMSPAQLLQSASPSVENLGLTCVSYILQLAAMVLMAFVGPLVIERKLTVGEALRESGKASLPSLGLAMLIYLVIALVAGLGALACGIGMVFTYAFLPLSIAATYRRYFPVQEAPPPPATVW